MRAQIKALTLCAATLTAAAVAGAQGPTRPEQPNRKQAEFNCPVCGSPCVSKAALLRQVRQRRFQNQNEPQVRRDIQPGPPNRQWQGENKPASPRKENRGRQQELGRFDLDGDGQLSPAEKAARRAYRDALDEQRVAPPRERPAYQPPVE